MFKANSLSPVAEHSAEPSSESATSRDQDDTTVDAMHDRSRATKDKSYVGDKTTMNNYSSMKSLFNFFSAVAILMPFPNTGLNRSPSDCKRSIIL